jgi:hypothetical protein
MNLFDVWLFSCILLYLGITWGPPPPLPQVLLLFHFLILPFRLVTCGLAVSRFAVACPNDPGMLDVAGFDAEVPRVIEAFSRGAF